MVEQRTTFVGTSIAVVDPIAVADVQLQLSAIPPDRVLYEAWKELWVARIELSCVDQRSYSLYDLGAAVLLITSWSVSVLCFEPAQYSRSVHERMYQPVDGVHIHASLQPLWFGRRSGRQNMRQRHVQDLIGDTEQVAEGLN